MKKARKYLFIFLFLSLCLYLLVSGIFGQGGYFYNRSLRNILQSLQYRSDKLQSDIQVLKQKSEELETEEGLRNTALNLGYYIEGDSVYLFSTSGLQTETYEYMKTEEESEPFRAFSKGLCILISISASLIITALVWFADTVRKSRSFDEDDGDSISYPD